MNQYFGEGRGGRWGSSFITFRGNWSTCFVIPDNNRRTERYRNFSLLSECLLLFHLSYVLPQNDTIFDKVPVYKELNCKNHKEQRKEHDALSTRTKSKFFHFCRE
jgi:hypothetical protein